MKKIIEFIIEINNASFIWYVAAGAFLYVATYAYPTLITETKISMGGIAWLLGISVLLKAYDAFFRKKTAVAAGKWAMRKIIMRLKHITLYVGGSIVIFWALFGYGANREIYVFISKAGIPTTLSIVVFFIAYWCVIISAITSNDQKEKESVFVAEDIKNIYLKRREQGETARLSSSYPIRRYAHIAEYEAIVNFIRKGDVVLDAGCGDGSLAILLAKKGAIVTACDISPENIAAGRENAVSAGLSEKISFMTADAENLPFPDNSFDWVVSSHVLEHLPHFEKGLAEIRRITKKRAVIAMPTCLNPCAAVILGSDMFWRLSRWSATAWFVGSMRILLNLGGEGIDEGYAGDARLPHVWRYPWVMRRDIRKGSFRIIHFQASSFALPYMQWLIEISKWLEQYRGSPILRNLGYGSIAVVEK